MYNIFSGNDSHLETWRWCSSEKDGHRFLWTGYLEAEAACVSVNGTPYLFPATC